MTLKVFSTLLFYFVAVSSFAQHRLSGTVTSQEDSTAVAECVVYIDEGKQSTITDQRGKFVFEDVTAGNHMLHFMSPDFKYLKVEMKVTDFDQRVRVKLEGRSETLEEVVVTDTKTNFGFTRMGSVENMGIYEGKKSEVIIPDQLVANTATNNARQLYNRVAGLNIWENDGAGLQLSIGGRGLDPNRTSNFNVRQNMYDISADALGYPESYYTPPAEAIGRIQIVRGAASLQYGTQFGGLINFQMKQPVRDKKVELIARQTLGSWKFYNAFTSLGGTVGKLSYYTFFQYKRGDGWRPNADFNNYTFFANVNYKLTTATKIGFDLTKMGYLAHQPGGLTDEMFEKDPRQSNRERNWFDVDWNVFALHVDHSFSTNSELNLRVFGLVANRYSIGFRPNRVATIDDGSERDLIKGDFRNWGAEVRWLKRYHVGELPAVLLAGTRYYHGFNHSMQGPGSTGSDANFNFVGDDNLITYDYRFPNENVAFFAENIFHLHDQVSITPGMRWEYIDTHADGYYGTIYRDLAGNILDITRTEEKRTNVRHFPLFGVGVSYKPGYHLEAYGNISQNYRSITFSDMRISNPSSQIDPNLKDEKGYSIDLGIRSDLTSLVSFDVNYFYLNYDNRIGEIQFTDESNRVGRLRANIGQAIIQGMEAYGEIDVIGYAAPAQDNWIGVVFANVGLIHSNYKKSEAPGVEGNSVEFVPDVNLKTGLRVGYKNLKASFQYTYLSDQFTDATNATDGGVSAVIGLVPAYSIMDFSLSYQYKIFRVETSVNNLANAMYFTRRATGYPGPGILPSDGRSLYVTLQVKL
jgi:Fe(3+) dicitrate transport protein